MKKYLLLYILILTSLQIFAQGISVSAPSRVSLGESFRVMYTINAANDVDNFRLGGISSGLNVVGGPYTSSQSSFQMINGHTSSSSSTTYTYVFYASKNGTYNIASAHARIGGKALSSRAIRIIVSGSVHANNRMGNPNNAQNPRASSNQITGKDLFIKVSVNKNRVREQEPVLLTYKVYTTVDLTQLNGQMPDLAGFHTQQIDLPQQKTAHIERVNGRVYNCITWSQYVMYPQVTGKLTIPSIPFDGIVVQQDRNTDPLDAFINGTLGATEVKKRIIAPSITIQVDPLPTKSANFSGGVGTFNMAVQPDKSEVKAGNPITLRVIISGTGNLKLIKQPTVHFPQDFDSYDAKITDKTKVTTNGVEGSMIYDFLAVPRSQGKYIIPAVEFTYYDTSTNQYKTIKSKSFNITVDKGDANSNGNGIEITQDIRPIKLGDVSQNKAGNYFFSSASYWIIIALSLLLFTVLIVIFRKRAINNADIVGLRDKKANKIATKRLRLANQYMLQGKSNEFYDEVLHALWDYAGDKLNMRIEHLSRENISDKLYSKGVSPDAIEQFISTIDDCEYERYAPGDVAGNMNKTFERSMDAILKVEDSLKMIKRGDRGHSNILTILLLMLCLPVCSFATTKQTADLAYKAGQYQQAIKEYKELLHKGVNASLYYNLGNAYYRSDSLTKAILSYERALKLSLGNSDIRFNLQFARSKTIDKIQDNNHFFMVNWYYSLATYTSINGWAYIAIASIIIALCLALLYIFNDKIGLRKIGFFGSIAFIVLFILCNVFAYTQKKQFIDRKNAIVISPSTIIRSTPSGSGTPKFVIHEGTSVDITDNSIQAWKEVKLGDGRGGWVQTNSIEMI